MPPESVNFGGDFELDYRAYEVRCLGQPIRLSRIPMELLILLIERRGDLVTRDEIIGRIWGKDVFLDTDNGINAAIRKLRQCLKDDSEQPRFIQTVTGKGYRFIAPVTAPADSPAKEDSSPKEKVEEPVKAPAVVSESKPPVERRIWVAGIAGLFIVFVAFGYVLRRRPLPSTAAAPERIMLAVLPFENFTGDKNQDYFSDGLTEETISQLGDLDPQHLGVIARTSVMHYQHSQTPLDQIGRELGIQYVLEGSVRRDGDKVRITAQLVQLKDQSHIWAREYDRELSSVLEVQGDIAHEVTNEIENALGNRQRIPDRKQPALTSAALQAYDLDLKGLYFWNERTSPGLERAISCFHQAIAINPNDARAYAGLAASLAILSGYTLQPQTQLMPKAREAALKALELDDTSAEAHTSLALISENYDWNWQKAESEFKRAIELNPNYATAHHWYAEFLANQGRFNEAFAESNTARQLDPLSLIIAADGAENFYFARQYDRAISEFRAVLDMDPDFPRAHIIISPYLQKGMYEAALEDVKKRDPTEVSPWTTSWLAIIYARSGKNSQAQEELKKLRRVYQVQTLDAAPMLAAYAGVEDKDQAFAWFERAYAQHSNILTTLRVDPLFDPLRSDPRFEVFLHRIGLAQPGGAK